MIKTINNLTFGIIGLGVVGNALKQSLELQSFSKNIIITYDKYKNIGQLIDLLACDIIFVCLPTPIDEKTHFYDISAFHEMLTGLSYFQYMGLFVVKSTVSIGTTSMLSETYNVRMCHNPEFLTARTAFDDFNNPKQVVLGVSESTLVDEKGDELYKLLKCIYELWFPNAIMSECTPEESESMKLFCNSYYAVKIQLFNEYYLLTKQYGNTDYNVIRQLMINNGWIEQMHTQVPGPDQKLSYGGACLPKDTLQLNQLMAQHDIPHAILDATICERNTMRD